MHLFYVFPYVQINHAVIKTSVFPNFSLFSIKLILMNIDYVKTPFTNNPSMIRLEEAVYNQNPNKKYLQEKQKQIDLLGENY